MDRPLDAIARRKIGRWILLFPLTYAVHILEEYFAGEGFPAWAARTSGAQLSSARFLMMTVPLGVTLWVAMLAALRARQLKWLPVTLSVAFLLNTLTHTGGTLRTDSYSPGLVSAWLLWVPLSVATLVYLRDTMRPSRYLISVLIGVAIQGIVMLAAR